MDKVLAARRVLDCLVGYKVSPFSEDDPLRTLGGSRPVRGAPSHLRPRAGDPGVRDAQYWTLDADLATPREVFRRGSEKAGEASPGLTRRPPRPSRTRCSADVRGHERARQEKKRIGAAVHHEHLQQSRSGGRTAARPAVISCSSTRASTSAPRARLASSRYVPFDAGVSGRDRGGAGFIAAVRRALSPEEARHYRSRRPPGRARRSADLGPRTPASMKHH
jgi:hypothetical protein